MSRAKGKKMCPKPHRAANRSSDAVLKAGAEWRLSGKNRAQRAEDRRKARAT